MATFNKFQDFVEQLGKGVHQLHAAGHTLKVYLTNATPSASADTVKTDLAEISMTNEATHGAGGGDIQNDWSESGGTATLTGTDVTFTASGGTVGPFEHTPMYNDTPTSPADPLIGWWTYAGGAVTLQDGETFTVDFGTQIITLA